MTIRVKICGLSTAETIEASVAAGADYLGFNFYPKSPRSISLEQARALAAGVPSSVLKVSLTVDADDRTLDGVVEALQPDILQLHGAETPDRLVEIKSRYGITLMKVIGIAEPGDPELCEIYRDSADLLLFDAKPPKSMAG
ncbi:MAG: phosphoribosylanthranilate isomerase, partial [Parvibaculum sp.]